MVSRIKRFTLYRAILHFFLSLAFGIALVGLLWSYFFLKNRYVTSVFDRYTVTLNATKDNITSYIQSHMRIAQHIAESPELTTYITTPVEKRTLPAEFQKRLNDFSQSVVIFSAERKPLFASQGDLAWFEQNAALHQSLERSKILTDADLSDFVTLPNERPRLYITVPIIHKNKFIGSFAVALHTQTIEELVSDYTGLGKTGEIIITQRMGDEIITIFPTRFNPNAAFTANKPNTQEYAIMHDAINGSNGHKIIRNAAGTEMLATWHYTPLTYNEWAIIVQGSYEEALQPFFAFKIFLICLVIFVLCGTAYSAYKSWTHAQRTVDLSAVVAKALLIVLYVLFIINSVTIILFVRNQYNSYHIQQHTDRLIVKSALQKAAQTIDYRVTVVENAIASLALDITRGTLKKDALPATLAKELQGNPDLDGVICVFKQDNGWNMLAAVRENGQEKTIQQTEPADKPWIKTAQEYQATWIYLQNMLQKESELLYNLPLYDAQDFEQKRPIGFIGCIYAQQTLLQQARQKTGPIPLLLVQGNGNIVYKDQAIPLTAKTIDPLHNTLARLYLERATHLGWYIGSMAKPVPLSANTIATFVFGIVAMLLAIALFMLCLIRYYARGKRYHGELVISGIIASACTALALWLTFGI